MTLEQEIAAWRRAGYEDFYDGPGAKPLRIDLLEAYRDGWAQAQTDEYEWRCSQEERFERNDHVRPYG